MSSNYPPPPTNQADAQVPTNETPAPPPVPQNESDDLSSQPQVHPQYAADAAASAVAHHSLQALQDAVAGPPPPTTPLSLAQPGPSPTSHYAPPPDGLPYHPAVGLPSGQSPVAQGGSATPPGAASKATRLRRACDMCSQRKVKCDETQPCRPCRDLGVDCTFNRAMKRRGPPNKHAEAAKAAKRPRLDGHLSPGPHNAAETLISIAGIHSAQPVLSAELIAPFEILVPLIDDFFKYIHPLAPFPHEPTFRNSFMNREDRTNREFLALLASMVGCLVASYPRAARLHLKRHPDGLAMFPKAINLIERCRVVATEARGTAFPYKDEVTVYDAATSYFLGLAAGYTMQWKICRRFMSQTMDYIREMGYHKPRETGSHMFGVTYRGPSFNHVEDQLGKRLFWCMFVGVRSMVQLGAPQGEIIFPPPTPAEPYPEFPAEVDDQYILPHQILVQPEGVVSLMAGFIQGIKIYMTMNGLVSIELSYGISSLGFHDQKSMLDDCLGAVKQVMDHLPPELTINLNHHANDGNNLSALGDLPNVTNYYDSGNNYVYLPPDYLPVQTQTSLQDPETRRLQYEIQKANIYASQLATRSYYVERYLNLRDNHREQARVQAAQAAQAQAYAAENAVNGNGNDGSLGSDAVSKSVAAAALHAAAQQQDPIDTHMFAERELIVQNLLTVLTAITQRNMEPNGSSLINKIRQVASTLLNCSPDRKGPVAQKAEEPLSKFVDILMRLERAAPTICPQHAHSLHFDHLGQLSGMIPPPSMEDEEQELRNWADLKEQQIRFLQGGGFVSLI
ncbi:hypothetical protein B0T21DRAFT_404486 [Apiosordaria backusii]|uniref:Zn(2)-C6 fungal-type domain-containing protein n=1 Tax=Apiosordaria backusii TaxID=314023 RepID=A0AA40AIM6_9PEZI|nr:hypothetical protein B0T21DRAFT_404486 [Apiosordaria backusii]